MTTHPTPFTEVNRVLDVLLPDVQAILEAQFIGMYLHGSLASGDFDRESDVDFVVVTAEELPEASVSALDAMHSRIMSLDSWCATQLEGSYIPLRGLKQFDPQRALYLHIDRGRTERLQRMRIEDVLLSRAWWGGWVLLRFALREKGITLAGPDPRTLINLVSPDDLMQATLAILDGWGKQFLANPALIEEYGYQPYTVLTMCRILYTLEYGVIASKPAAARWAQGRLEERWCALVERAWKGRSNPQVKASLQEIQETQDFIRYTLEYSQSHPSRRGREFSEARDVDTTLRNAGE